MKSTKVPQHVLIALSGAPLIVAGLILGHFELRALEILFATAGCCMVILGLGRGLIGK